MRGRDALKTEFLTNASVLESDPGAKSTPSHESWVSIMPQRISLQRKKGNQFVLHTLLVMFDALVQVEVTEMDDPDSHLLTPLDGAYMLEG